MVTGVGNATLYQGNLVKGYLTIPKKPGVRPISIPHPLGWGGRTQFDFLIHYSCTQRTFDPISRFYLLSDLDFYILVSVIEHIPLNMDKYISDFYDMMKERFDHDFQSLIPSLELYSG